MADEYVLDASVAAKVLFDEAGSEVARDALAAAHRLIAPDWIVMEFISIAVKKVRAGVIKQERAQEMVADLPALLDELVPVRDMGAACLETALSCMTSAYDGVYAALARREGLTVLTADQRLARALRAHRHAPAVVLVTDTGLG